MKTPPKPIALRLLDQAIDALVIGLMKEPIATGVSLGIVVGAVTSSFSGFAVGVFFAYVVYRIITERAFSGDH